MADTKTILNHIKSIRETRKITNAMYLISSTKLRKARKSLDDTRPFFRALQIEISKIVQNIPLEHSRFFVTEDEPERTGTVGILVLTADKGLAGAYNQNVIRESMKVLEQFPDHHLFVHGEYGKHFFASHNIPYDSEFDLPDTEPTLYMARRIAGYIMDLYEKDQLSQVYIVYSNFKNAMSSEVRTYRLLPFEKSHFDDHEEERGEWQEYEYIPSPLEVMEKSIPVYSIGIIYSILVYSFCSEQDERMMAMDAANQNADHLLKGLTVAYNHMRQNEITQEITEISSSVKASRRIKKK